LPDKRKSLYSGFIYNLTVFITVSYIFHTLQARIIEARLCLYQESFDHILEPYQQHYSFHFVIYWNIPSQKISDYKVAQTIEAFSSSLILDGPMSIKLDL